MDDEKPNLHQRDNLTQNYEIQENNYKIRNTFTTLCASISGQVLDE